MYPTYCYPRGYSVKKKSHAIFGWEGQKLKHKNVILIMTMRMSLLVIDFILFLILSSQVMLLKHFPAFYFGIRELQNSKLEAI
jgi:hypothetical protein